MDSTRDYAYVADAKRTTAAALRQIAKTLPVQADRTFLISHASWLEAEALEKKAATADHVANIRAHT
jgi:hypothetical protein